MGTVGGSPRPGPEAGGRRVAGAEWAGPGGACRAAGRTWLPPRGRRVPRRAGAETGSDSGPPLASAGHESWFQAPWPRSRLSRWCGNPRVLSPPPLGPPRPAEAEGATRLGELVPAPGSVVYDQIHSWFSLCYWAVRVVTAAAGGAAGKSDRPAARRPRRGVHPAARRPGPDGPPPSSCLGRGGASRPARPLPR